MYKIFSWAAVILWMALIFILSSQAAEQSNQLSTGITEIVVEVVKKIAPQAQFNIEKFNHIIRKNAHFFAYLVLGILVLVALRLSGVHASRSVALALGICVLYAISDEIHQFFVPGRGGEVKDVIIDSVGVTVGIGIYWMVKKLFQMTREI